MEAARRLYGRNRSAPGSLEGGEFDVWLDAWYSDIWDNHFTEEMRQQVLQAYGPTLPDAKWMRAMEGLRMLDQLRATDSITEAVLQHLAAVLDALREFLSGLPADSVIRQEIDAIKGVLEEYGYEGAGVKPEKAKKKVGQPKAEEAPPEPVTPEEPAQLAVHESVAEQPDATVSTTDKIRAAFDGLASAPIRGRKAPFSLEKWAESDNLSNDFLGNSGWKSFRDAIENIDPAAKHGISQRDTSSGTKDAELTSLWRSGFTAFPLTQEDARGEEHIIEFCACWVRE